MSTERVTDGNGDTVAVVLDRVERNIDVDRVHRLDALGAVVGLGVAVGRLAHAGIVSKCML